MTLKLSEEFTDMALVCVEKQCKRYGIKVFNLAKKCIECGGDLFPLTEQSDGEFEQALIDAMDGDPDFSDDMIQRLTGGKQENKVTTMPTMRPTVVYTAPPAPPEDTFTCPADLESCPIAKKAKVYIPIDMFNKWIFLAGQLNTEWIAYLKGFQRENQPDCWELTEMYFPKQKAHGTHCDADDNEIREGTIAAVHSHVGMNVFFSSEDKQHFNHRIELVVNRKGEIMANGRVQLECGRYHRGPCDMVFIGCEEELNLQKQLEEVLRKDTSQFSTQGYKGGPDRK